jgi:hypothetical protein
MIIQVIGLPGTGKTTFAKAVVESTDAIHLNADEVRKDLNKDLGFSLEDRTEQSRRMGALARLISNQGRLVIVDFVCPTKATRDAFGPADYIIWIDRIKESVYEDTNNMWEDPDIFDIRIPVNLTIEQEVDLFFNSTNLPNWKKPTTLMLGRYQPWHEGHEALKEKAYERTSQVVIGVRNTQGTSEKDPMSYKEVADRIRAESRSPFVVKMPNITNIVYGRDVGYKIEQIDLGAEVHAISATQKRKELGI